MKQPDPRNDTTNILRSNSLASRVVLYVLLIFLSSFFLLAGYAASMLQEDMQQRILLATLLLSLFASTLLWWTLKRQFSPMRLAARTLELLPYTNRQPQPLPIARQDEVGMLAGAFNRLLRTIEQVHEALQESEERFRNFFDKNSSVMLLIEPLSGKIIEANQAAARYYGYPKTQLTRISINEINTLSDELQAIERASALHEERNHFHFSHRLASGEIREVEVYTTPIEVGARTLLFSIVRDITERRQAEEKLHLAASVFTHAREGILITDAEGMIIDVNDTFSNITGYCRDEVLGLNPKILNSGHQSKAFYAAMWHSLLTSGHWYGEIWNRRKNGEVYAQMLTISAVHDEHGNTRQYVALFSDITLIKEHERQLEHIAHYDALTTLPNRVLLADRLHQGMMQAQRRSQPLAVVFLDLDGFKAVNDNHGHETGDQLLITLAERMKHVLREGDTLARLGGDEFVAVLLDLGNADNSVTMLSRLLHAAAQPVQIGGLDLQVSASAGLTFYPQAEEVDADQLLRQADQAMYQAKLAGKNCFHVFDAEHDRNVRGLYESLDHIRNALEKGEFLLHYQPKVNMRSGAVVGAEALIRWQHPQQGLLPPAAFLPTIEDHQLAIEVGEWVIDTALRQMSQWHAEGLDIPVSVNIGARQLLQHDFTERLIALLAAYPDIMPGCLELEVLETSALKDLTQASLVMEACRRFGVHFALDDFGTGYSSLTYLRRLPVTHLKVDQTFVRGMLDNPDDLAILEGVLGLATAFHRNVIAEGVETEEHGRMLLQLGCEVAQGYGIAHPMPAQEFHNWTRNWQPPSRWRNTTAVSRDDLSVLFACVEHRAWIIAIEAFLKGEREAPPALDHEQCRFGNWMNTKGIARHGAHPAFESISILHCKVHHVARELMAQHANKQTAGIEEKLKQLHSLRDELLDLLHTLAQ